MAYIQINYIFYFENIQFTLYISTKVLITIIQSLKHKAVLLYDKS